MIVWFHSICPGHYVAQGRTKWGGWSSSYPDYYCQANDNNQAQYSSSVHGTNIGVGCCSSDGTKGYRPNCNAHPATYADAVAVCSDAGYRLCTLDEMMSGITEGTGCWYDTAYQWVTDSCVLEDISLNAAAIQSGTEGENAAGIDSDGDADHNNWTVVATAIGAIAVMSIVILMLLMKKRKTAKPTVSMTKSATATHVVPDLSVSDIQSTTTGHVVEVSLSTTLPETSTERKEEMETV